MIWWLVPCLIIPYYFIWNFVHELSHCMAVIACGGQITSFRPWPHKEDGAWYFGQMKYVGKMSDVQDNIFHIAPYTVDLIIFTMIYLLMTYLYPGIWLYTTFVTLLGCPIANTTIGILGRFRRVQKTDLSKVSWKWAVPFFAAALCYYLLVGGLIWSLIT